VLLACVGLLVVVVLLSLALGTRSIPPAEVLRALLAPVDGVTDHTVVRGLRVPRTVIGLLAGTALGMAGALMQGVTRNPLADPGLLGVNAGASLAVVLAIAWLGVSNPAGYIWFALAGAVLASLLVYGVAGRVPSATGPVSLAIAGTATSAALASMMTVVLLGDVDTLAQYRFWSVGSLTGRDLATAAVLWPFVAAGAVLAAGAARSLDLLALGDDVATGLGARIGRARALAGGAIVLLAGTATALAGPIVLLGLVVAHVARAFAGADHRRLLALAAVLGPTVLLAADVIGRLVLRPAELEAGIVAAFLGAPVLVALVRRSRLPGV
jgi:iron complex transport system permease protein